MKLNSYCRADSIPVEELWWAPLVRSFRALPDDALPPRAHSGVAFNSVTVNTMKYLAFLVRKVRSLGGRIIRFRVPTKGGLEVALKRIEELLEPPDLGDMDESSKRSSKSSDKPVAYVNCTGMGARVLVPDSKMYPIRGQTILVKGEASCIRTLEGFDEERKEKYVSYVIPRKGSGTTILGGTKQEGNWHVEADEQTTKDILQRCRELAPELLTGVRTDEGGNQQDPEEEEGEFEVVRVNVGLRPAREGGARVELDESIGNGQVLVHCYGHAGAGYQNSVGAARKVIGILEKRLRSAGGNITEGVKAKI
ncbi:MAG: hypothetical protein M1820_004763 [Bogoriella megaspora]|nr:MAG: hypothetical protein M1820_004763 [Bogoriella megaspora]